MGARHWRGIFKKLSANFFGEILMIANNVRLFNISILAFNVFCL